MEKEEWYKIENADEIITPALIYYEEAIKENIAEAIRLAGGADKLWPHVKSHKSPEMIRLQESMGIDRFKCATIAEAEMTARCHAKDVLLAYPLVGPNIGRFVRLVKAYPDTAFWAIGDDEGQISKLSEALTEAGETARLLLDLNSGMDRTGVLPEVAVSLYEKCRKMPGIAIKGIHCYDGNHAETLKARKNAAEAVIGMIRHIREKLAKQGMECPVIVAGGSPTFYHYSGEEGFYLSPGTVFLMDAGYGKLLTDVDFKPAAALLTRVVSHPAPGLFTVDLGYKSISSDTKEPRGVFLGGEGYILCGHSEEHWVLRAPDGETVPPIGTVMYVLPSHICPANALYPYAYVVKNGLATDKWHITARVRRLMI